MTKVRNFCAISGVFIVFAILTVGVGEVSIRLVHLIRDDIPFWEPTSGRASSITMDDVLGWRTTENFARYVQGETAQGRKYEIRFSQGKYGFRQFSDVNSSKRKLLVIGDSFTQAGEVSDDKTYYALLQQQLDVEVSAYGAGGYGTLQEYMILDQYFDVIKPDILIWQFCSNDFINNDLVLERLSVINNNGWKRPYWFGDHLIYQVPRGLSSRFREWAQLHARFPYFVISRIDKLRAQVAQETVEDEIDRQGFSHPDFVRAFQVTDTMIAGVRRRVGDISIVAFNCTADQPYFDAFKQISARHGISFYDDIPVAVDAANHRGEDVLAANLHWNESGHRLVGNILALHLSDTFSLPLKSPSRPGN